MSDTINPGSAEAIDSRFSVDHLKSNYLFGIDLVDNSGNPFPDTLFYHHLNSAIQFLESILDICITPVTITNETHDFYAGDFGNWGYLELFKKPAIEVTDLGMLYGQQRNITIPLDWIKLNQVHGSLSLFPTHGSAGGMIIGASGAIVGLYGMWDEAPGLWQVSYKAGMTEIPFPVYDFVYKKASINVLQIWGDLILGAGIASQSISIDGISQSLGTTKSTSFSAASARCDSYQKSLDELLPILKSKYDGIRMGVI